MRVTKAGIKSYILQYRIHVRHHKFTIGRHGDLTAEEAWTDALELRGKVTSDIDPQADKKKGRGIPTLSKFSEKYLEHARGRKETWNIDQTLPRLPIPPWLGYHPIDTMEKRQIQKLHHDVREERIQATANRHLSMIKHMFNLAVDWSYIEANPARSIKTFKENNHRTNWLDGDQIGR